MTKRNQTTIEVVAAALLKHPLRSGLITLAGVATVIGCGYSMLTDHSVRFSERTGRGFYRLPPLPLMYDKATGKEISAKEIENYDFDNQEDYEARLKRQEQTVAEVNGTWDKVTQSIEDGKLGETRLLLEQFLTMTELPLPESWDMEEKRQSQRNTAMDMVDAIGAVRQGSSTEAVKAYLDARRTYDEATPPVNIPEARSLAPSDRHLNDNWDYLEAAAAYKAGDKDIAHDRFTEVVVRYTKTEKKEAASYMLARIALESSHSFGNTECGLYGEAPDPFDFEEETTSTVPVERSKQSRAEIDERCRDGNWHTALEKFGRFMLSYPDSRYFDDARGWVAYLHRRGGHRAEALTEYYRMLGHPTSWKVRLEAKRSLQMLGHHYDDETLDRVEDLLADDVNGAMAYAYHRIYNHANDFTNQEIQTWRFFDDDWSAREKERERVDKLHGIGKHELERVVKFATKMMQRYPRSVTSGGFVARVAEAQLELQNFDDATKFATKALALGVRGDIRAQALWVKGSGEHHGRHFTAAEATFKRLVAEFPQSKFVEGSRRLLAMIAEDRGDLESALEMYFALNYETDVAYFLDVLLPTDRLAKFIESHKGHPEYNQLLYGLGVRYTREKRWDDARTVLRRVQTERGVDSYLEHDQNETWYFAKEPGYEDEKLTLIKASWVMRDLKTIDTLEHYENAVLTAEGDEAKAEAMYQLASAYYEADDLAFYNPAAWGGGRVSALTHLQFTDHQRQTNESQIILEHMRAHDPWANAIPIFEEVVARFPSTKVARDALYSAAVAHERLSNRNGTWAGAYLRGLFPGPRLVTYSDVRSTYPDYQLPRGTYGWKPSTRTVNGGPGWAPPEKPKVRETREQKVKRLLREFGTELSGGANKLSATIQLRVEGGLSWYGSMIEAAVYGILSGIALWALILVGIKLHLRRVVPQPLLTVEAEPPSRVESRVDKMIE